MNKSPALRLAINYKFSGFTLVEMAIVLAIVALLLEVCCP